MAEVPLAEAITDLRRELQDAMAAGQGEQLKFELDSVVLELEVTLSTGAGAGAKAGFWSVLTAEATADHRRGSTHRLTLTLTPRLSDAPDGQRVRVGDDMSVRPHIVRPE
ncbi:trypco2 family protein [Streptomyces sp. NPDC052309]|uniref:trypco2 family protein n=1 Tax=Streptomyces sp. NPDC052309 TaxID=3155421 RepID=UPI003446F40E